MGLLLLSLLLIQLLLLSLDAFEPPISNITLVVKALRAVAVRIKYESMDTQGLPPNGPSG